MSQAGQWFVAGAGEHDERHSVKEGAVAGSGVTRESYSRAKQPPSDGIGRTHDDGLGSAFRIPFGIRNVAGGEKAIGVRDGARRCPPWTAVAAELTAMA